MLSSFLILFLLFTPFFLFPFFLKKKKKKKNQTKISITINKFSHNQKAAHPEAVAFVDPDPVAVGRFLCKSQQANEQRSIQMLFPYIRIKVNHLVDKGTCKN